ncbi:hypothetical protein ACHAWF_013565 [Thalassiosira exigua]
MQRFAALLVLALSQQYGAAENDVPSSSAHRMLNRHKCIPFVHRLKNESGRRELEVQSWWQNLMQAIHAKGCLAPKGTVNKDTATDATSDAESEAEVEEAEAAAEEVEEEEVEEEAAEEEAEAEEAEVEEAEEEDEEEDEGEEVIEEEEHYDQYNTWENQELGTGNSVESASSMMGVWMFLVGAFMAAGIGAAYMVSQRKSKEQQEQEAEDAFVEISSVVRGDELGSLDSPESSPGSYESPPASPSEALV